MGRVVYRPGHPACDEFGMVPIEVAGPKYASDAAPAVISDCMSETKHMADGKVYTSKAKFRQATKAAGCVEVGNELSTLQKPRKPVALDRAQRRDDIRRSIYELRNGIRRPD
jgi:hypothetical protein